VPFDDLREVLVALVSGAAMGWLLAGDRSERRRLLQVLAAVSLIGSTAWIWGLIQNGSTSVAVSLTVGGGAALVGAALRR
jgi:hypothetical protein